jgi:hypothetical protein
MDILGPGRGITYHVFNKMIGGKVSFDLSSFRSVVLVYKTTTTLSTAVHSN